MATYGSYDDPLFDDEPPQPVNWNLLSADEAELQWRDLDAWVTWLKTTFGLPPTVVPPFWHRHDELIWELSALHDAFLSSYDTEAPPSAPIAWMHDFADARRRLQDWVATCGTRLDRDRPTRQTQWPGEAFTTAGVELTIRDRAADFDSVSRADVERRRSVEQLLDRDQGAR